MHFDGKGPCYLCGWWNKPDKTEYSKNGRVYTLDEAKINFRKHLTMIGSSDPESYQSKRLVGAKESVIRLLSLRDSVDSNEEESVKARLWENINIIREEKYIIHKIIHEGYALNHLFIRD